MVPRFITLVATLLLVPVATLVNLRGRGPLPGEAQSIVNGAAATAKEPGLHGLPICPGHAVTMWNSSGDAAKIAAAYNEIAVTNSRGHMMFTALSTNLGAMGVLRDQQGRSYAYLSAYGSAADAILVASGDEVDVVRTPAPPPARGYLSFKGIEAVVEMDKDDVYLANGTARPVAFFMQLQLEPEAFHWKGWPRSFSYTLAGYVHLPTRGIWRLLSETQGRIVTDGTSNHAGFLGGFTSFMAPLGKDKACTDGRGDGSFGPAWYTTAGNTNWVQFSRANITRSSANDVPSLLRDFPSPKGDNSPASHKTTGFRDFGPKRHHLSAWGQYYNQSRVYSCVTPDLAAVMADPSQYTPPPEKVPDFNAQGFCEPLVAEHFWWDPLPIAAKEIEWFYNEITVEESAPYTYFMANGFSGGYMGIQEHPDGKKFALFSIWDAGSKVEIVDWGEGVRVGRFGAEGTGANSNLDFQWEIGQKVQFLVHVKVEPPSTPSGLQTSLYSGYIRIPSLGVWRLMSKLRVTPCGVNVQSKGHFLGLNSFIEVFQPLPKKGTPECEAYSVTRRARYGVPWYRRAGTSTFVPFSNVTLTTTCGEKGCPRRGMDFQKVIADGQDAFVLVVGKNVTNTGLPQHKPQAMLAAQEPPAVLTETPLPESDNSLAGRWRVGEARPLRSLGKHEQMARWGAGAEELACPWYVQDCTLPPGLPDDGHGLR